jgi:2,4-dienoyl-CoA reductase-like NADH-dependent reductase (Old Yellow Enzyme family)
MLADSIKIGGKIAPNRIANQPMECNDADQIGRPTELTFNRYRNLAQGGAGVIFLEALTITQECRARKNQLGIYEKTASSLERLVRAMREINRESIILFQIAHSGHQGEPGFSRLVSVYPTPGAESHLLTEEEIEIIGDEFARAAVIAQQVGADGIDFKQCHGYLCTEMLRPANIRRDRFGGSFENRVLFFTETVNKIRKAMQGRPFILGSRISVYEGIPGGIGTSGPNEVIEDLSEPLAFVQIMQNLQMDYINVSAGGPTITPEILRPTKNYPEGVYRHFGWAQAIKKRVRIPIIGSGYSYLRDGRNDLKESNPAKKNFLYWAEKNICQGNCDLVGLGRQSLADPLFAKKIFQGRASEINYCITCGGCSQLIHAQMPAGCVIYSDFHRNLLKRLKKAEGK